MLQTAQDKSASVSRADTEQVRRNVRVHNRIARRYDAIHGEISNPGEQARLRAALARALEAIRTERSPPRVLDMGCGSGNLSRHLLDLGAEVVAADVSVGFLDLVNERYAGRPITTARLNGEDLRNFADGEFDMVATYSVLHHIPDYLAAVDEMARVTRPGGVVYIDHEHNAAYWAGDESYRAFRRQALRFNWRKYLTPSNYLHRVRRIFHPRYSNEGDIHVWPDDHIDWPTIENRLAGQCFEMVFADDFLLDHRLYRREVYDRYRDNLNDMRAMAMRKVG